MDDRLAAAKILKKEIFEIFESCGNISDVPCILVDTMTNATSLVFGALPERLAILWNKQVYWLGGKGPADYKISECRDELNILLSTKLIPK